MSQVILTEIPCLHMQQWVHATFCECYGILPFCFWDMSLVEVRLSCSNVSVPVNLRIFLAYFPLFWRRIREDIGNRSGACDSRSCYTDHVSVHQSCVWHSNEIFLPRRDPRCRVDLRGVHEFLGLCVEGKCTPTTFFPSCSRGRTGIIAKAAVSSIVVGGGWGIDLA